MITPLPFYIPCWFHVDSVFAGIHVETDQNDDYINLYCIYDTRVQSVRLSMIYVNNSAKNGEQDFELEVEIDATTSKLLLNQAVEAPGRKSVLRTQFLAWTIDATSAVRSIGISPCSAQHSGYSE